MSSVSISVVIPVIPKHNRFLPSLIRNISSGSIKPVEIIISGSSQTPVSRSFLNSLANNSLIPIRIATSADYLPPGINRNIGWEMATSPYVTFCDADDTYSRRRLEVLQKIISETDADLIIHNYARLKPRWYLEILPHKKILLTEGDMFQSTFPRGNRVIENENGLSGDTNLLFPQGTNKSWRITHGHATVKRTLELRYGSKVAGEDGQFCRDVLFNNKHVVYTPNKLSNYDRPTLTNLFTMSVSRIHADLAVSKNQFLEALKKIK